MWGFGFEWDGYAGDDVWRKGSSVGRVVDLAKEVEEGAAFIEEVVGAAEGVGGFQIRDAHRVIDRFGDVSRTHWGRVGVGCVFVGAAEDASALDAASGHEDAHAGGPVVASGSGLSSGAGIADEGFTAHFARDEDEGLVEEVAVGEVFEEGGEGAVELGEEVLAEAGKV